MMLAARGAFLAARRKPKLPYDAEVEYLESTGTQWIDTNVNAADNVGYEIGVVDWAGGVGVLETRLFAGVFGSENRFGLGYNNLASGDGRVSCFAWWNYAISNMGDITIANGYLRFNYLNDRAYSFNGVITGALSGTYNASNTHIRILNAKRMDTGENAFANSVAMKFSSFKISQGTALANDMIPVRFTNELGQSEGAMYDRVNPTVGMNPDGSPRTDGLYRNRGTGAFVNGPDKTA